MATSEARISANRLNAQHSTGPKTDEGKARSRRNGLKHGMSGSGIVVLDDDLDEIDARAEALGKDMDPKSPGGAYLVRRMATFTVRMDRSSRQESASVARNVRHAAEEFDEARLDEADALFDALAENPRRNLRKLLRSPEGVERLVDAWHDLRQDLLADPKPIWAAPQMERAALMNGTRPEHAPTTRIGALSRAAWGDFARLNGCDGAGLDDDARQAWARGQILELIDAEVALLETRYQSIDFRTIAVDRLEAGDRALFDNSKAATLARRYETETQRSFFKALKEFRQIEDESLDRQDAAPSAQVGPPLTASLGSSRARTSPPEPSPDRGRSEWPDAGSSTARTPEGGLVTVGRATKSPG